MLLSAFGGQRIELSALTVTGRSGRSELR